MNYFLKLLFLTGLISVFNQFVFAADVIDENQHFKFEIVQDKFIFDLASVNKAYLYEPDSEYKGLVVELKPEAANYFEKMIQNNLGKRMNLVFNNMILSSSILQSPLGNKLILTGLNKAQALTFLSILNNEKQQKNQQDVERKQGASELPDST